MAQLPLQKEVEHKKQGIACFLAQQRVAPVILYFAMGHRRQLLYNEAHGLLTEQVPAYQLVPF